MSEQARQRMGADMAAAVDLSSVPTRALLDELAARIPSEAEGEGEAASP